MRLRKALPAVRDRLERSANAVNSIEIQANFSGSDIWPDSGNSGEGGGTDGRSGVARFRTFYDLR